MKEKKEKPIDVQNDAERAHAIIDKYIRNEDDRNTLKKELTPLIIQFLLRWDGDKEMIMEERIVEIVMKKMQGIYLADNARLCEDISNIVSAKLAETLASWNVRLGGIEKALENVDKWQKAVDELHIKMDARLNKLEETVFEKDHERLITLERYASPKWTFFRMAAAIVIATSIALAVFSFVTNKKVANVERLLQEHVEMTQSNTQ